MHSIGTTIYHPINKACNVDYIEVQSTKGMIQKLQPLCTFWEIFLWIFVLRQICNSLSYVLKKISLLLSLSFIFSIAKHVFVSSHKLEDLDLIFLIGRMI